MQNNITPNTNNTTTIFTHPNFKSIIDPNIRNAKIVEDKMFDILILQEKLEKQILIYKNNNYQWVKMQNSFNIDVQYIDRLYYMNCSEDCDEKHFELIARLSYNEKEEPIYVELHGFCNEDEEVAGVIRISTDVVNFMRIVLRDYEDVNIYLIYQSFRKDGIPI